MLSTFGEDDSCIDIPRIILLMFCFCEPLVQFLKKNLVEFIIIIIEIVRVLSGLRSYDFYSFHLSVFTLKYVVLLVVDFHS